MQARLVPSLVLVVATLVLGGCGLLGGDGGEAPHRTVPVRDGRVRVTYDDGTTQTFRIGTCTRRDGRVVVQGTNGGASFAASLASGDDASTIVVSAGRRSTTAGPAASTTLAVERTDAGWRARGEFVRRRYRSRADGRGLVERGKPVTIDGVAIGLAPLSPNSRADADLNSIRRPEAHPHGPPHRSHPSPQASARPRVPRCEPPRQAAVAAPAACAASHPAGALRRGRAPRDPADGRR